jgi:hypothetical protein
MLTTLNLRKRRTIFIIYWLFGRIKSKRASIAADPLLTNPLNSDTKLQIGATSQNNFLFLCITFSVIRAKAVKINRFSTSK